jgi:hypothetical protein
VEVPLALQPGQPRGEGGQTQVGQPAEVGQRAVDGRRRHHRQQDRLVQAIEQDRHARLSVER